VGALLRVAAELYFWTSMAVSPDTTISVDIGGRTAIGTDGALSSAAPAIELVHAWPNLGDTVPVASSRLNMCSCAVLVLVARWCRGPVCKVTAYLR
jgi:hypothetical protein